MTQTWPRGSSEMIKGDLIFARFCGSDLLRRRRKSMAACEALCGSSSRAFPNDN
jgi:hypothetical protein